MPNRRSPDAAMSPFEVHALLCVGDGSPDAIKPDHRDLQIRMQLAKVNGSGLLELTEDGGDGSLRRHRGACVRSRVTHRA